MMNLPKVLLILIVTAGFARAAQSDLSLIQSARQWYGLKKYDKAISEYSKVETSSDFFARSREERAHTYGRMGQYQNVLSDMATLMNPVFENSITPEAYFTLSLTYLRLCQYKKVYETITTFKKNMKPRLLALTAIKDRKSDAQVMKIVETTKLGGMSTNAYAKEIQTMPLLFQYDNAMNRLMNQKASSKEAILKRMAQLADADIKDISKNLDRLQLVEADLMQNLNLVEHTKDNRRAKSGKFKAETNQLEFPYDGEVWIDELDSYQAQSKNCPGLES